MKDEDKIFSHFIFHEENDHFQKRFNYLVLFVYKEKMDCEEIHCRKSYV